MRFDDSDSLDTSNVQDRRGSGGGTGLALGGGGVGIVGVIVYLLLQVLGGGGSGGQAAPGSVLEGLGSGQTASGEDLASSCPTGADANAKRECAVVADIQSIQDYWGQVLGNRYEKADTVFFSGSTDTGCGTASSGMGPFYCPADRLVYIDLTFYDDLRTRFGAQGGTFVDAYVLAHEYGHHVQDLLGTESTVQAGVTGATSGSVRLELQADCYAGTWAHHAETTPDPSGHPLVSDITGDDVARALDTAGRIGDDSIERNLGGGTVDPDSFTHGTSAQRQRWFTRGYDSGDPNACDTFSAASL
ncbi:MAG: KPN_02809 family neutral zinc metallopeptidase [Amnibacterium sp.]